MYLHVRTCPIPDCTELPSRLLEVHATSFFPAEDSLPSRPGVEFEDRDLKLGKYASLRVAAAVDFPRQLPLEEGDQALNVRVSRLGLKARIN
jgi:hypothetical protein